jgi:hypothetical protein
MESRILQLIAALRGSGVRISLAESSEAFRAVEILGITQREQVRLSLSTTLIKDQRDLAVFNRLFALYFGSNAPPAPGRKLSDQLTPEELRRLAEALLQIPERLRANMEKLGSGTLLTEQELEGAGRRVGIGRAEDLRHQNWLTERLLEALRLPEVQQALQELVNQLERAGSDPGQVARIVRAIRENIEGIRGQVRRFVGRRLAENLSDAPQREGRPGLMDTSFDALSDTDKRALQREVMRLAAALRTRIALRQKRAKGGQLDPKSTIRANLRYHGVPLELRHRDHIRKPKLVLLCDVSTSMRFCAELMLGLLFALQSQVRRADAFAFIDHLESISGALKGASADEAVATVLRRMRPGHYNTDLGWSLNEFQNEHLDTLDGRTTLIVLGDGRNNHNDPRIDVFARLCRRAARTIWLNPEPPPMWRGDSDMPKYAPLCNQVLKVANVRELAAAVNQMIAA